MVCRFGVWFGAADSIAVLNVFDAGWCLYLYEFWVAWDDAYVDGGESGSLS